MYYFTYLFSYMEIYVIRHTQVDVKSGTCYGQSEVALKSSFKEEEKMRKNAQIGDDITTIGGICGRIVGIVTGICFLKERAFCKYCPLGTLRGFVNKISFGKIKKDGTACTHCRACLECCPMDIRSIYEERNKSDITHSDCIYCMKCIEACPEQDVLSFTLFGKKVLSSKRNSKQVK